MPRNKLVKSRAVEILEKHHEENGQTPMFIANLLSELSDIDKRLFLSQPSLVHILRGGKEFEVERKKRNKKQLHGRATSTTWVSLRRSTAPGN